jgi:hypothetical protein
MKRYFTFFQLVLLLTAFQLNAQYVNVKINSAYIYGEEWIAMNPKNLNQIVTGTHLSIGNTQSNMGYFYSSNGGFNWSGGTLLSTLSQPGTDPVILADTSGNFYYICIANWGVPPPNGDKMLCIKSTNGGVNWNNGTAFALLYPKFDDMPMGCVDFSHSQYGNNIYVTWTLLDSLYSSDPTDSSYVYLCRSTDQGISFSSPVRVSKIAGRAYWDNSTPEGPVPCTGTNGEVYVCYPYNEQVLFNRSTDGGNTWLSNEVVASNQPGGWTWHHSPVIACDLSNSQYSGTIYICFSDLRNGSNDRDIWLIKSTNRGNSWSNPLRVNNDSPGHMQELPWICVDRVTGYVWIVFYDSRNYSNGAVYDVYVARSTNGGTSFQNVKVSNANSSTMTQFWLGDYIGITAHNNKVRPVWTTSTGWGISNLWTAIIDTFTIGVQTISNEIPKRFVLNQNYPNPFNPSTKIKFDIPSEDKSQKAKVKLVIYDILGKEVQTLVNEQLQPGSYEVTFDARQPGLGGNLPSGVYFCQLLTEKFNETKRMILLK